MDDLNIYHVRSAVVDNVLWRREEKYVKVSPLTSAQGKVHYYLGMLLSFRKKGKVRVKKTKQIRFTPKTATVGIYGLAETPPTNRIPYS